MNENTHDRSFCPSCGVEWHKHEGMVRTCADLQRLRSVIHSIHSLLELIADIVPPRERKGTDHV